MLNLFRFDRWDADGEVVETIAFIYNGANQIQCIDINPDSSCACEANYSYDAALRRRAIPSI